MRNLIIIFLVLISSIQVAAQNEKQTYSDIKSLLQKPNRFDLVRDYAFLLSTEEEKALRDKLHEYNTNTTTQIQLITIPNLENYQLDSLSLQLATNWQIGQKNKNNGILILVVRDQQQIRVELGKGIKPLITSKNLQLYLQQIHSLLKSQLFYEALDQLTTIFINDIGDTFTPKGFEKLKAKEAWIVVVLGLVFFAMGEILADDGKLRIGILSTSVWIVMSITVLFLINPVWLGLLISGIVQGITLYIFILLKTQKIKRREQAEKQAKVNLAIEEAYEIYKKHDSQAAHDWKQVTTNTYSKKQLNYKDEQEIASVLKQSKDFAELANYIQEDKYWMEAERFYTLLPNLINNYRNQLKEDFLHIPYQEKHKSIYLKNLDSRLRLPFLSHQLIKNFESSEIQHWLKDLISNNNLYTVYPAKLDQTEQRKKERIFLKTQLKQLENNPHTAADIFLNLRKHWTNINKKSTSIDYLLSANKTKESTSFKQEDDDDTYQNHINSDSSKNKYGGGSFDGTGEDISFS